MLNDIQKSILKTVSDMTGIPDGAVNIRLDDRRRSARTPRAYPDRLQDRQGRHRHQDRALYQERKRTYPCRTEQSRVPRHGL